MPQTREGAAAWRAATRPGAFGQMAMMGLGGGGAIGTVGLNWPAVLAYAMADDDHLDKRALRDCLSAIEEGRFAAEKEGRHAGK